MSRLLIAIVAVLSMLPFTAAQPQPAANPVFRVHKPTMTPVEMAHGETLVYERGDGETLRLKLTGTAARILYTNRDRIPRDESGNDRGNMYRARLLYTYTIDLEVNGMPMTMRRYVGSQESFFEPFVINGVRIWPIGVSDVFEEHGGFLNTVRNDNGSLRKDARLVLQDMDTRICPAPLHPWYIDSVTRAVNRTGRWMWIWHRTQSCTHPSAWIPRRASGQRDPGGGPTDRSGGSIPDM